jgi:excisionase family DNA binding protein
LTLADIKLYAKGVTMEATDMEWLTIQQAAEYLKISVPTIRKYVRLKKLPSYRHGRIIRLQKDDLDKFLSKST